MTRARTTRPDMARGIAPPRVKDPQVQRALEPVTDALRDLMRDPSLPRSGATGDVFYRGADGRIVALPAGIDGQVLTLINGVPTWRTP